MPDTGSVNEVEVIDRNSPKLLAGGVVIEGFPGTGFASTIASSCLVSSLKLSLVGELWSDHFPSLATVLNGRIQAPARIYADVGYNLAIFLGDFVPGQRASHVIARAVISWAIKRKCSFVLTSFSTPMEQGSEEHFITGVANGPVAERIALTADVQLAELTAVGGVAGRMLLEGREAKIPVLALLIKTHKNLQDFESGLKLAEAIMRMVPNAKCDLDAIREEAARTEGTLRRMSQTIPPDVYK